MSCDVVLSGGRWCGAAWCTVPCCAALYCTLLCRAVPCPIPIPSHLLVPMEDGGQLQQTLVPVDAVFAEQVRQVVGLQQVQLQQHVWPAWGALHDVVRQSLQELVRRLVQQGPVQLARVACLCRHGVGGWVGVEVWVGLVVG